MASKLLMSLWPLITLIVLGVTLFFNYYSAAGRLSDYDVGDVSDFYNLPITPSSWTFTIWAFIYIWQIFWIIVVLVLTCKYSMPSIIFTPRFYITYCLSNVFNTLWIIVWVNQYIVWSAVFLVCISLCLIYTSYVAHKFLFVDLRQQLAHGNDYSGVGVDPEANTPSPKSDSESATFEWLMHSKCLLNLLYIAVLNGVPFYTTWCVIATHLNVGIMFRYRIVSDPDTSGDTIGMVMLAILTLCIAYYWYLDFYRLRNYLRFTYAPYIVLLVAFCGVLTNGELTPDRPTSIYTLILLIVAIIGSIAKVIMGIYMAMQPGNTSSSTALRQV